MKGLEKPVFILGVGAQKAGTSWLHAQIKKQKNVDMGFAKEYHVWDAVYLDLMKGLRVLPENGESLVRTLRGLMQSVDGVYENYFYGLINETVRITGDITPTYACLDAEQFVAIKKRLEELGFFVKVFFLMRDPVERNWSALRMHARGKLKRKGVETSVEEMVGGFRKFYESDGMIARTRYDLTVKALREAFDKKNVFYGFYENLFHETSLKRLSNFLGVDLSSADVNERVNQSEPAELSVHEYQMCREFYSEVYGFCNKWFPVTEGLWAGTELKGLSHE